MRCPLSSTALSDSLFTRSESDRAGLIDAEHCQRAPQTKEHRDAQRQIEDFRVGELIMQPPEERVVDRSMVIRETFGVLDGKALPGRVAGVGGVCRDIVIK